METSGVLTRNIVAGQTYEFGLSNDLNVSGGFPSEISAYMTGNFDWTIRDATRVAEPGRLALLAFGLVGLGLRRR